MRGSSIIPEKFLLASNDPAGYIPFQDHPIVRGCVLDGIGELIVCVESQTPFIYNFNSVQFLTSAT
jgi:hypothetical protein